MALNSMNLQSFEKKRIVFRCRQCGAILDSQLALREHEEEIHFHIENEREFSRQI